MEYTKRQMAFAAILCAAVAFSFAFKKQSPHFIEESTGNLVIVEKKVGNERYNFVNFGWAGSIEKQSPYYFIVDKEVGRYMVKGKNKQLISARTERFRTTRIPQDVYDKYDIGDALAESEGEKLFSLSKIIYEDE